MFEFFEGGQHYYLYVAWCNMKRRWATTSEQNSNKRLAHGKPMEDRHIYFSKRDQRYTVSIFRKYIGTAKSLTEARALRDKYA